MTKPILLRSPNVYVNRRHPLLGEQENSSRGGNRLAEVVGGTTAECAAVCCCCPCGLVNLLVLAVYKVPAGLCRKALRRKRRRRMMKKGLLQPRSCSCSCGDLEFIHLDHMSGPLSTVASSISMESDKDMVELEKEMWNKFDSAGFWRSLSQKSDL